jgi:hypothetical protein
MLNANICRCRSRIWLYGIGGEIKLVNVVFPITLVGNLGVNTDLNDQKGFLSLGMSVHFPGNLLSSNIGTGVVRDIFDDKTISYYGLFGVELLNIIYGEYQAVRKKPDLFRFGLRLFL